jgi:uncharacterized protein with HEPN domain
MELQSKKYLDDILYAVTLIEEFIAGINSFADYEKDLKTRSAVEQQLGIIGEATNKYDKLNPDESLENTVQITGLRNRIIHAYDSINNTVIWAIIINHLPKLKVEVQHKLAL